MGSAANSLRSRPPSCWVVGMMRAVLQPPCSLTLQWGFSHTWPAVPLTWPAWLCRFSVQSLWAGLRKQPTNSFLLFQSRGTGGNGGRNKGDLLKPPSPGPTRSSQLPELSGHHTGRSGSRKWGKVAVSYSSIYFSVLCFKWDELIWALAHLCDVGRYTHIASLCHGFPLCGIEIITSTLAGGYKGILWNTKCSTYVSYKRFLKKDQSGCWWLMPVILATWKVEIGRVEVWGQPRKKFTKPHLNRKSWVWWHAPVTLATAGSVKYEAHSPGWPGQKVRPYLKNNQRKKGWRHGSNPRTTAWQACKPWDQTPEREREGERMSYWWLNSGRKPTIASALS
jgi:hypothetical protein